MTLGESPAVHALRELSRLPLLVPTRPKPGGMRRAFSELLHTPPEQLHEARLSSALWKRILPEFHFSLSAWSHRSTRFSPSVGRLSTPDLFRVKGCSFCGFRFSNTMQQEKNVHSKHINTTREMCRCDTGSTSAQHRKHDHTTQEARPLKTGKMCTHRKRPLKMGKMSTQGRKHDQQTQETHPVNTGNWSVGKDLTALAPPLGGRGYEGSWGSQINQAF